MHHLDGIEEWDREVMIEITQYAILKNLFDLIHEYWTLKCQSNFNVDHSTILPPWPQALPLSCDRLFRHIKRRRSLSLLLTLQREDL
jgi:hypothetical protein